MFGGHSGSCGAQGRSSTITTKAIEAHSHAPFCQRFFLMHVYPLNLRQNSSSKFLCGEKIASLLWRGDPAFAFVAGDHAVTDMDDAVGVLGDVSFMGDQHDGVALAMEVFHQLHDFVSGL
jgi:hypothetical protein